MQGVVRSHRTALCWCKAWMATRSSLVPTARARAFRKTSMPLLAIPIQSMATNTTGFSSKIRTMPLALRESRIIRVVPNASGLPGGGVTSTSKYAIETPLRGKVEFPECRRGDRKGDEQGTDGQYWQ